MDRHGLWIRSKKNTTGYNQNGVVRTNCLDCLDRTNVMQAKLSITIAKFLMDLLDKRAGKQGSQQERLEFIDAMKRMWNQNGDNLSQ